MKTLKLLALVLVALLLTAAPLWAQGTTTVNNTSHTLSGVAVGAGLGAAITILGAGYGFGRIGGSALESMARQPEVAGRVQTAMIIIAALLEGATFFALIICIVVAGNLAKEVPF
jgi:F-type H+-transporting ATPase subunit c